MNKRKFLLLIIILLIVLVICIIGILFMIKHQSQNSVPYEEEGIIDIDIDSSLKKVSNRNNYYIAKTCVNKLYAYYTAIHDIKNDIYILDEEAKASIENQQKQNAEIIYNLLDEDYISFSGITKENILTKLQKMNASVVNITNMYVSERTTNMSIYVVEGNLREKASGEINNFKIMLKIDSQNRTFTVFLQDYIDEKYKQGFKVGDQLEINVQDNIAKNEYNIYEYNNISDETYVTDLFSQYKEEIIYNPELAYNHLNEEYRNKRFETIENFKTYANNNVRKNVIAKLNKYQKTQTDDYTQYVCIDQNGNYYIFRETDVMDYTLILDTYTIDLPEFIEKYEASTENEKVLLNIQKIFDAINSGDYKYVYNKLDDTFKSNYFKTQANFENYVKEKWYTNNGVSYGTYEKKRRSVYIQSANKKCRQ